MATLRQSWYQRVFGRFINRSDAANKPRIERERDAGLERVYGSSAEEERDFPYIPVTGSSNVAGFRYRHREQVLEVKFLDGSAYAYLDVPESVYDDMFSANSKGQFVWERLRDDFAFSKIANGNRKGKRQRSRSGW